MMTTKKLRRAFLLLLLPFLFYNAKNVFAQNVGGDDDTPDVTARTARISLLNGDAQIKRADSQDWERAVNNLPVVEGDEIATGNDARLEIQFDSTDYVRISSNTYLKITTLRDEGIALSLPNGTLSARVLSFEKDRSYFEIDAPGTTVSVERAGLYRVDAGSRNDSAVRVAVNDSGQARIYSESSGLTLKNGRSATIRLDGDNAGEWEIADAARYADAFDSWTSERDAVIAKRLRDAGYDKYYDRDFYGAEDLSDYGEWVYTKKYGYVWKPDHSSIAGYADWSPYRYGQWRWVPPYGWTWVNDEPWGYATYHHGRWIYEDDYWYWSPYPQHRGRRSWWRPALVVLSYISDSVCWYPLPYSYGYYSYNSYYYRDNRRYHTTIINNTTVIVNPTPSPTPSKNQASLPPGNGASLPVPRGNGASLPQPPIGVTAVPASDFGRNKVALRRAPADLAKKALAIDTSKDAEPPALPTFKELNGNVSQDILIANPKIDRAETSVKTGATVRIGGTSTGETLRKERIFGNRAPVEKTPRRETPVGGDQQTPIRSTGAVKRQPRSDFPKDDQTPIRRVPDKETAPNDAPIRQTGGGRRKEESDSQTPVRSPREKESQDSPPIFAPPSRKERREPEQRQEPVRVEPPRREERKEERQPEPPRQESPRPEPRREEPVRSQPEPPKQESPKQESPKQESPKQEPPSENRARQKDG
ncbi:MAG: FecR domain-containing protein [Acidobacteriota bacterium]|nr:FecR domain-containing protein [Acidobacteriota bacterium]